MNETASILAHPAHALTPEAIALVDLIARRGSFAAAARELGRVPSALTYSVRQLEDALDVLLFDRSSRQARLTEAGRELLQEGRRVLADLDAVANRVRRVATGWESQLALAVDNIVAPAAIFDLIEAFYALRPDPAAAKTGRSPHVVRLPGDAAGPPTRIRLRSEVLSGTWEALTSGSADLVIAADDGALRRGFHTESLGRIRMLYCVAPHHPLADAPEPLSLTLMARHRIVAIADSARGHQPMTLGIQPGQDVLTVPSLAAKLEAQLRGLGSGHLPEPLVRRQVGSGRLVVKRTEVAAPDVRLVYAWHDAPGPGLALRWWLEQLASPTTRRALLEQHAGLVL